MQVIHRPEAIPRYAALRRRAACLPVAQAKSTSKKDTIAVAETRSHVETAAELIQQLVLEDRTLMNDVSVRLEDW